MNKQWKRFTLIVLVLTLAAGCGSGAALQPPTPLPTQAPTAQIKDPDQTTPIFTPTLTLKPTVAVSSQALATKAKDLVGVWYGKIHDQWGTRYEVHLEFTPKGICTAVGISGETKGVPLAAAQWKIEGNQLKLQSEENCKTSSRDVGPCVGIYQVTVTKQGDKSVELRFAVVEDLYAERKLALDKLTLTRVEP